jgi:hypothetical protein
MDLKYDKFAHFGVYIEPVVYMIKPGTKCNLASGTKQRLD